MFIITGQDLAANRALFELVDPFEDLGQCVGVGGDEDRSRRSARPVASRAGDWARRPRPWPAVAVLGSTPWTIPPARPIAMVCNVTPRSRARMAACSGSSGRGTAGSLLPSVSSTRTFFSGGASSRASSPTAIASPMLVPSSPGRAGRTAATASSRKAWSRVGGQTQVGIVGEDDQADQVVGTPLDEPSERRLGRFEPRDHPRAAVRREVDRLHARALVQRHDDRDALARDPGHAADGLRPRQRHGQTARSPARAARPATPAARPSRAVAAAGNPRSSARRSSAAAAPAARAAAPGP